jgi:hypothetical protein
MMNLTAIDVINQFLEFQLMVPDTALWKESELRENLPKLYRLNQLRALFLAFDLGKLTEFEGGGFVKNRPPEAYQTIWDKVQKDFKDLGESTEIHRLNVMNEKESTRYIISLFERLFLYRKKLFEVLAFNSGVLAASGLYYYAFRKTENFNQIIKANLESIDNIIGLIISPDRQSFPRKQLIEEFGYPDVDLSEIDMEWI